MADKSLRVARPTARAAINGMVVELRHAHEDDARPVGLFVHDVTMETIGERALPGVADPYPEARWDAGSDGVLAYYDWVED